MCLLFIYIFYCAVILYSIHYILCYKLLKSQISFNGAEPALVVNRLVFIIMLRCHYIAALTLKFPNSELG